MSNDSNKLISCTPRFRIAASGMSRAHFAGYIAVSASLAAVLSCLVYVPILLNKIGQINNQLKTDADEFNVMATEAWETLMLVRRGEKAGVRRTARQAGWQGGGSGGYNNDRSLFVGGGSGRALPDTYQVPPLPYNERVRPDEFVELTPDTSRLGSTCSCETENRCPAGPAGAPGYPGSDGESGLPGPPGEQGLPGNAPPVTVNYAQRCRVCPQGPQGRPGQSGQPGQLGESGPSGLPGRPGNKGIRGYMGPPGVPGEAGKPGKNGDVGPPGQDGVRGQKGEKGKHGPSGPGGQKGSTGFPGPDGQRGLNGRDGPAGQPGQRGQPGEQGVPGPPGLPGLPGQDGQYCDCPSRSSGVEKPYGSAGVNRPAPYPTAPPPAQYVATPAPSAAVNLQPAEANYPANPSAFVQPEPSYSSPNDFGVNNPNNRNTAAPPDIAYPGRKNKRQQRQRQQHQRQQQLKFVQRSNFRDAPFRVKNRRLHRSKPNLSEHVDASNSHELEHGAHPKIIDWSNPLKV